MRISNREGKAILGGKPILSVLLFAGCAAVAGLLVIFVRVRSGNASGGALAKPDVSTTSDSGRVVLACPGRVEGLSELVEVGSGIDGVLREVLVKEGEQVRAGQTLAIIDRRDTEDDLKAARAAADAARQTRALLIKGSRDEERLGAAADSAAAEADYKQARLRYERMDRLFREGVVSPDARDQAKRDLDVAEYKYRSARDHERFVDKGPLKEELAKADADIRAADGLVAKAAETLEKCKIKAPMPGTILRCNMKAGEAVSTVLPKPIITMADTSKLRVRAEVDERDIGRVFSGQVAKIRADALAGTIGGRVTRIEGLMGRKKIRTGDPAEKSDRDVLEVLIDMDAAPRPTLAIGLRVTVQFEGAVR
jgi:HlyD family secretion protein